MPTLLAALAHPDDESACSGLLAMARARGWRVVMVYATRGEAGEISDPALATPETLGAVREQEVIAACAALGISDLQFLNYCDSGMAGTMENERATSFIRADETVVRRQLLDLIDEYRPELMVTFEPFGIYGHPDHIAISRLTTEVWDMAAAGRFGAWRPARLYYFGLPMKWLNRLRAQMASLNLDLDSIDRFRQLASENPAAIDTQFTHELDVSAFTDLKTASLACHHTQLTPHAPVRYLLLPGMRSAQSVEYYIQARPAAVGADFFPD